jgi:hypothetical protein
MDIFPLLVVSALIFLLLYVLTLLFVDCDLALAWAEKFGKPIGKLVTVTVTCLNPI